MDKNLYDLTLSELISMYHIVLHNRGVLGDEFYVAYLIRQTIVDRLMPDALKIKGKEKSS